MTDSGKRLFDALMSGDVDRLAFEMEEAKRDRFKRNMPKFMAAFKEGFEERTREEEIAILRRIMGRWLCHRSGQHDPPADGGKGDLIRWIDEDGMNLPSIRRDLAESAVQGKIIVQGQELIAWIVSRLDAKTRLRMIDAAKGRS